MKISDLKPNQGNVDITAEVVDKEEPRTFEKFGKAGRVCNLKIKDESGEVKLTLWNEDIDKVNEGDTIHLQNGWCSEYKSEKQLSTGKFGKVDIIVAAKTLKAAKMVEEPVKESPSPAKSTFKPVSKAKKEEKQSPVYSNDPEQFNADASGGDSEEEQFDEEEFVD